jgi:hypothetical protein
MTSAFHSPAQPKNASEKFLVNLLGFYSIFLCIKSQKIHESILLTFSNRSRNDEKKGKQKKERERED